MGGNALLNTDYTLSGTPGVVVIPTDAASATITLHSIADGDKDPNGTAAKISVQSGNGYILPPNQPAAATTRVLILDKGS